MPAIPTIQVHIIGKGKEVFQINESDFDPEIHKRLSDKEEAVIEKAADVATRVAEKEAKK